MDWIVSGIKKTKWSTPWKKKKSRVLGGGEKMAYGGYTLAVEGWSEKSVTIDGIGPSYKRKARSVLDF